MKSLRSITLRLTQTFLSFVGLAGSVALTGPSLNAQVSYVSGAYTQNFDTLATTGTTNLFTDNETLVGWYALSGDSGYTGSGTFTLAFPATQTASANTYRADTGASNTGALYSYGASSSSERALGSVGSGTPFDFYYGVAIKNDTGGQLTGFTVTYDGEQWRRGGVNTPQRAESLLVYYRIGGTALDGTGTWIPVTDLNFVSPNLTDTAAAALNGNDAANRLTLTKEISALVPAGETVWILWVDPDNAGSDHGMAIDNFIFTGTSATTGAPAITSATTASITANSSFSYFITASASPTSFSATGLPAGLTVNTSTGEISGVPTVPGTYPITISATNGTGTGAASLTLTVNVDPNAPAITAGQTISAVINTAITPYQIVVSNSPTVYSSGTLPAGLVLDSATGIISGTPTVAGAFSNISVSATNSSGVGTGTISITVASPPVITSELSVSTYTGVAFSYTLAVSQGINSVLWSGLPDGVTDTTATVISGTPTVAGTYTISITASNDYGSTPATLTMTVIDQATQDAIPANVVINKYVNGTPDKVELLVIGNGTPGSTVDLRGMVLKDFSGSMVNDGGGKYLFAANSLWSAVPAGTLIVLSAGATEPEDLVASDFVLKVNLGDTTYFTLLGGTFDIATTEMVMLKAAGYGALGVAGGIHVLAGGTAGAQYSAFTGTKLIATGTSGTNIGVIATNSTSSLADFEGADATGGIALASLTFGAGNNTTNQAYIDSLRTSPLSAVETWRQTYFGTTANTGGAADSADFDGDGIANLIEYATGTNPTVAGANPVTLGQSGGFLTLTFNRINDSSLTYVIQASNDLAAGFTNTGTSYSGTANDTVTYTDTVPLATAGKRFLRLQVVH